MWRFLSGVAADQIYRHLDQQKLFPEEHKICSKRSRGINNLLYIGRAAIRKVKAGKENLAMVWRDHNKVYDVVPHSCIKECLELFGVAEKIKTLLTNSMEKWRIMLCLGN